MPEKRAALTSREPVRQRPAERRARNGAGESGGGLIERARRRPRGLIGDRSEDGGNEDADWSRSRAPDGTAHQAERLCLHCAPRHAEPLGDLVGGRTEKRRRGRKTRLHLAQASAPLGRPRPRGGQQGRGALVDVLRAQARARALRAEQCRLRDATHHRRGERGAAARDGRVDACVQQGERKHDPRAPPHPTSALSSSGGRCHLGEQATGTKRLTQRRRRWRGEQLVHKRDATAGLVRGRAPQ
mmetsp:Transcript_11714/g.38757  ORF Transcript_11714/g.38757 Transcript_11714/m.38757 type:complete len:243 (-) Transcript_11714:737-1465(-)